MKDSYPTDYLVEHIKQNDNETLENLIIQNPSLVDIKTEEGISLLQVAAYCRNKVAIEIIKKYQLQLDLYEASSVGEVATVKQLINKTPGIVNDFTSDGFTPLGLAAFFGHIEIVKVLLDKGADPKLCSNNPFKVSPLHSACAISNYEIAKILIENGADVNEKQMYGVTPLHSASHNGQNNIIKLLLDNGADINAQTERGQTPFDMAIEKNFHHSANLLTSYGNR